MANQNIIGTTNCSKCHRPVNLKRDKRNKAYYFCTGELDERGCGRRNVEGGPLSNRIIAVAAKHGGKPHFTKFEFEGDDIVVEIKQEKVIDRKETEPEATEPEETGSRAVTGDSDNTGNDEWPYV